MVWKIKTASGEHIRPVSTYRGKKATEATIDRLFAKAKEAWKEINKEE